MGIVDYCLRLVYFKVYAMKDSVGNLVDAIVGESKISYCDEHSKQVDLRYNLDVNYLIS